MRIVTKKAVLAFLNRRAMKYGNMSVSTSEEGCTSMKLHGNSIARMDAQGIVAISTAGWHTRTTLCRLNGLLFHLKGQGYACTRQFSLYLNGAPWDGSWKVVFIPDTIDTIASRYRARTAALDALTDEANAFDATLAVLGREREITTAALAAMTAQDSAFDASRDLLRSSKCETCGHIVCSCTY